MVDYTITTKTIVVGKKPHIVYISWRQGDPYDWCTEMFGLCDYKGRWGCHITQSTASVVDRFTSNNWAFHFENEEDAVLFKLRWV